ncbi:glycoside hydrolase family 99-like domain-containing protein [Vibrio parahaemolyticus]
MNIYSFYFPQFYTIPEYDVAWLVGFTDWENVKQEKRLYDGHYLPIVPLV